MNKQTLTWKVKQSKRDNGSINGKPNFKLLIEAKNGHVIPVGTLNDSMINYYLGGHMIGKVYEFTLKVNRKSNKLLNVKEL